MHTFLFTDIAGSSRLWERVPDAMGRALTEHDALIANAVQNSHGRVFKSVGDGACCIFPSALDAATAAIEIQRGLAQKDFDEIGKLPVRMTIHCGEAVERGDDFFGPTLNRVARMQDLAHGGQILLSLAAYTALSARVPPEASLLDLGVFPLRDLGRPEHVHQLVHPLIPSAFPPLRSKSITRNNLPAETTSFVGRSRDVNQLKATLKVSRLVTVIGLGGSGKTRITLRVARLLLPDFADGVWFVELGAITDPALVAQTLAETLGVESEGVFSSTDPWLERLVDHVERKSLLIVLDNCEHLIEKCAEVCHELLRQVPSVRILASSREPLSIDGESLHRLEPLPYPSDPEASINTLSSFDSVSLFVERARAQQPGFQLSAGTAVSVMTICCALEGIPLALELAAARLGAFTLEAIAARVNNTLSLLSSNNRSKQLRHRSIRDMLNWSEELLNAQERLLFHRLSVFKGEFTLDAAEAICSDSQVKLDSISDLLEQLVRKSLVRISRKQGDGRYMLHASVREYSEEKLIASKDDSVALRHCEHFVKLVEHAEVELRGKEQTWWLDALDAEIGNIRSALEWGILNEEADRVVRATGALWYFWFIRGHLSEGRRWLERALAINKDVTASVKGKALAASGMLTLLENPEKSRAFHERALELARLSGNRWQEAMALFGLGWQALYANDLPRMQMLLTESRMLWVQLGDPWGRGYAASFLGASVGAQGDREEAVRLSQEAVDSFLISGDQIGLAYSRINFGELLRAFGEDQRAVPLYEEAFAACADCGNVTGTMVAGGNLGMALCRGSDRMRSKDLLKTALSFARDNSKVLAPYWIAGLGGLSVEAGDLEEGTVLLSASSAIFEKFGGGLQYADLTFHDRSIATLKSQLLPAVFERYWSEGRSLDFKAASRRALGEDLAALRVVSNR